jgi:hypothetical protein
VSFLLLALPVALRLLLRGSSWSSSSLPLRLVLLREPDLGLLLAYSSSSSSSRLRPELRELDRAATSTPPSNGDLCMYFSEPDHHMFKLKYSLRCSVSVRITHGSWSRELPQRWSELCIRSSLHGINARGGGAIKGGSNHATSLDCARPSLHLYFSLLGKHSCATVIAGLTHQTIVIIDILHCELRACRIRPRCNQITTKRTLATGMRNLNYLH